MKLDILFQHSRTRFGQYTTWLLLLCALVLACSPVHYVPGPRSLDPATIISFLPTKLITSLSFYVLVRWTLIVSAVAWMFRKYTPWSCWATCISFTVLWSLRMENTTSSAHLFNLTCMLLVIHAMWFQFYDKPMRDSRERGTYWEDHLYPRWVFLLSLFFIGLFHTLAGLTKIHHSGFGWGTGLSLQLWIQLFDGGQSPLGQFFLSSRSIARMFQTMALVAETISILALFSRHLRWLIGFALLGYYLGFLAVFVDFGFHLNAIIVALFFLPVEPLINRKRETGNAT